MNYRPLAGYLLVPYPVFRKNCNQPFIHFPDILMGGNAVLAICNIVERFIRNALFLNQFVRDFIYIFVVILRLPIRIGVAVCPYRLYYRCFFVFRAMYSIKLHTKNKSLYSFFSACHFVIFSFLVKVIHFNAYFEQKPI